MRIRPLYLLKIWITSSILIAFLCAYFPDMGISPFVENDTSYLYRFGMFFGVLAFQIEYSVPVFVFLYLIQYLLAIMFDPSEEVLKIVIFVFFLIGVFISNHVQYPRTFLHPFSVWFSIISLAPFLFFNQYYYGMRWDD